MITQINLLHKTKDVFKEEAFQNLVIKKLTVVLFKKTLFIWPHTQ